MSPTDCPLSERFDLRCAAIFSRAGAKAQGSRRPVAAIAITTSPSTLIDPFGSPSVGRHRRLQPPLSLSGLFVRECEACDAARTLSAVERVRIAQRDECRSSE